MGSSQIAGQIDVCRVEIEKCKATIQKLVYELEELESAISKGDTIRQHLEEDLSARKNKLSGTDNLKKLSITGRRYVPGMKEDLTGSNIVSILQKISDARSDLRTAILNCDNELEDERNKLTSLNGQLGDLEIQYQNALNQEAWDREQERLRNQAEWDRKNNLK